MSGAGSAEPALMLLYDGDCGYCNGWVRWLLRHDAGGSLCFAMLQGAHGAAFLERVPALARLDSIILVEGTGEATRVYVRSAASIRLARYLGVPWSLFALVVVIPRPLRDALYDFVARHRYQWFGRAMTCPVPTVAQRRRFLDGISATR